MFKLNKVFNRDLIFISVDAADQKEIIDKIAAIFSEKGFAGREELSERFMMREKLSSTGVGHEIAIPHIFLEKVPEHTLLIMTLKNPVNFHSHDGIPIRLVLALISNQAHRLTHLRILAKLSRVFTKNTLFAPLMECESAAEAFNLLEGL